MPRQSTLRLHLVGVALALAGLAGACKPELVIGKKIIAEEAQCSRPDTGAAGAPSEIIEVPWTTGYENGFCDYERAGGICYGGPDSSHTIVSEPVHSGSSAAAFSVTSAPGTDGVQTRCFLRGTLPDDAVYGAWYFIPELAANTGNWNLFHFQGGTRGNPMQANNWDVSLENGADGSLHLYVRDFLNNLGVQTPNPAPPVPIGAWFHIEFRILRALDGTGAVALYQDETLLWELTNVITDRTDYAEWYVGNYAGGLMPPDSTVFVDDVTIRAEP